MQYNISDAISQRPGRYRGRSRRNLQAVGEDGEDVQPLHGEGERDVALHGPEVAGAGLPSPDHLVRDQPPRRVPGHDDSGDSLLDLHTLQGERGDKP